MQTTGRHAGGKLFSTHMFNLGFSELLVLAGIALIFIGPKQLPEVARALGRFINELKRSTSEVTKTFTDPELYKEKPKATPQEVEHKIASDTSAIETKDESKPENKS